MRDDTSWAGLDVHQEQIVVAVIGTGPKAVEYQVRHDRRGISKLIRKLGEVGTKRLECAYEAGPCGYELQRRLQSEGIECAVIAPSLTPVKPGERIKTDRRDARKLAEHLRAGLLTEVAAPSRSQEAARDLGRCRDDARQDLMRARHRLSKMLLRRGLVYREGKNWTLKHRRWLRDLSWEHESERIVFGDYLMAIEQLEERLKGLDTALQQLAEQDPYREPVAHLRCFRGIDTVTAMTLVTELFDVRRFRNARQLMSYVGLVPSEHSSGSTRRQGGITKSGNRHLRRALVSTAWHYRHRPAVGIKLRKRREGQPADIISLADRAQQRLHRRFMRILLAHNRPSQVAAVAVARELVGFVWAALQRTEPTPVAD